MKENKLSLRVFFDNSIVEVFINGGEMVMTAQVFPGSDSPVIELFSQGTGARINKILAWNIESVW